MNTYKCDKCGTITQDNRTPSFSEGGGCQSPAKYHSWRKIN